MPGGCAKKLWLCINSTRASERLFTYSAITVKPKGLFKQLTRNKVRLRSKVGAHLASVGLFHTSWSSIFCAHSGKGGHLLPYFTSNPRYKSYRGSKAVGILFSFLLRECVGTLTEIESPLTAVPVSKSVQHKYSKIYRRTKSRGVVSSLSSGKRGTEAQFIQCHG